VHSLYLLLDVNLNISTSYITSTPSALKAFLQLTSYINYLLTYLFHNKYTNILNQEPQAR